MKNFMKIAAFVTIPVLASIVLSLVAQFSMSAPTEVAAIADSGERWWNPMSWALDESAEHATMQANKSLAASVSYTQIMAFVGAMVSGIGLTMLIMAIRQGWVKAEIIQQAPAATSTPTQKPPQTPAPTTSRSNSSENDARDPALTGEPVATATA